MEVASHLLLLAGEHGRQAKLARELRLDGYEVHTVEAARLASAPSLPVGIELVMIATLDQEHGLCLLRALRRGELAPSIGAQTRVLWICGSRETSELLRAFAGDADDVLCYRWAYAELLARIGALLARRRPLVVSVLRCGALQIDTGARRVSFAGVAVALRRMEYELLVHLTQAQGRVCSKQELLAQVWGYRAAGTTRTVDSHACRLRRALQQAGAPPQIILTVWGVGYRLCAVEHAGLRVLAGGETRDAA